MDILYCKPISKTVRQYCWGVPWIILCNFAYKRKERTVFYLGNFYIATKICQLAKSSRYVTENERTKDKEARWSSEIMLIYVQRYVHSSDASS